MNLMNFVLFSSMLLLTDNIKGSDYNFESDLNLIDWYELNTRTFFFGHQSVGKNLIEGLLLIRTQYPQFTLPIIAYDWTQGTEKQAHSAGFYHSLVGKNQNPYSKINEFFRLADQIADNGSIVCLKFCYADITEETDVETLFDEYQSRVDDFKRRHPDSRIFHFTVPLTSDAKDIKSSVKKLLGRKVRGYRDNLQRYRYNQLLLKNIDHFEVFDIAKFQSTSASGERVTGTVDGQTYFAMDPRYTDDGGHLNSVGQEHIATEFLKFLSQYLNKN